MPKTATLLTSAEVCATLGVHRATLSRWVAAGKLRPAFKLNGERGAFLFRPADVARLAARADEQAAS